MQAASSHHNSTVDHHTPRSCLKKSALKKNHTVRFALPNEAPRGSSKLLAQPPRVLDFIKNAKGSGFNQLAGCAKPAARQMWLACGVLGTYHTLLQPSGARVALLGLGFVLPASHTLVQHGVRKSVARLLPPHPLEYFMATAAASAGIYAGFASSKS